MIFRPSPVLLLLCLATAPAIAGDPYFSEYVEGSSFNKAVEIYNPSGDAIQLSNGGWTLRLYFNGNTSYSSVNLSGTLPAFGTYVVCHPSASAPLLALANQTASGISFNGDDAVALLRDGVLVDVIGRIGEDPGLGWGSGMTSTVDHTLRRKADICSGDGDGSDSFDPALEWDGYGIDTFSGIGSHATLCPTLSVGGPLIGDQGSPLSRVVQASDPDARITSLQILSIQPVPLLGSITLSGFSPSANPGDLATATIDVSSTVPAGTYAVLLEAGNDEMPALSDLGTLLVQIYGSYAIAEIQGDSWSSPVENRLVHTSGIVTSLLGNGFFLQMPGPGDGDPASSDGLFVFTGAAPGVTPGDEVTVSGKVIEYFSMTELTQVSSVVVNSSGNPLPAPVTLSGTLPHPAAGFAQWEALEGMRVHIPSAVVGTGGLSGSATFFAYLPELLRPVRQEGLESPSFANLPLFDLNPELFRVQITTPPPGGGPTSPISAGQLFSTTGPVDYAFGTYRVFAESGMTFSSPLDFTAIRDAEAGECVVASFNCEFLDASQTVKLSKVARVIREVLKSPDLLALQEVVNQAALDALMAEISIQGGPSYSGTCAADVDGYDQETAFLWKGTVSAVSLSQLGLGETYPDSTAACSADILHDRPPYRLDALVSPGGGTPFAITLLNLHLRSFSDITHNVNGERVRMKRFMAARSVATIATSILAEPTSHLLILGDFNDYPFSDGLVDVAGIITGQPGFDLMQSNTYPGHDGLVNLMGLLEPDQAYSFMYGSTAQILDQMVASEALLPYVTDLSFGRTDADFLESAYMGDDTTPIRASDHDPLALFIQTQPGEPNLRLQPAFAGEGSILAFPVIVSGSNSAGLSLDWSASGITATAGLDFSPNSGTLVLPPGQQQGTIELTLADDALAEFAEILRLDLVSASGARIVGASALGTLLDNDSPGQLTLNLEASTVRLEGTTALKAWPLGASGHPFVSIQWRDCTVPPAYTFASGANPVVLDLPLNPPQVFAAQALDPSGAQTTRHLLLGDFNALLPLWNSGALPYDIDDDGRFDLRELSAVVGSPAVTAYHYPCDP